MSFAVKLLYFSVPSFLHQDLKGIIVYELHILCYIPVSLTILIIKHVQTNLDVTKHLHREILPIMKQEYRLESNVTGSN
jgi:hypothetical protein